MTRLLPALLSCKISTGTLALPISYLGWVNCLYAGITHCCLRKLSVACLNFTYNRISRCWINTLPFSPWHLKRINKVPEFSLSWPAQLILHQVLESALTCSLRSLNQTFKACQIIKSVTTSKGKEIAIAYVTKTDAWERLSLSTNVPNEFAAVAEKYKDTLKPATVKVALK